MATLVLDLNETPAPFTYVEPMAANESLLLVLLPHPPKRVTLFFETATTGGGYAFTGTSGQALGADRVDVPVATSYEIEVRPTQARTLSRVGLFVEADAIGDLQITVE